MSFRQFGGLQYASKHNAVASNYNTSNNLLVTQNVGQSNSYINFLSDISGNINIYGNLDISGNIDVSGDVDISGNLHVQGNIDCSGNGSFDNSIYIYDGSSYSVISENSTTLNLVNYSNGNTNINPSGQTGITVNSSGQVGIKNTSPSYTLDVSGNLRTTADALINGLTVGQGGGNVASNTAVGLEALKANTTAGSDNTAIGLNALKNNTSGDDNTSIGSLSLFSNTTGNRNTSIGREALLYNTFSDNTAIGYYSLRSNTIGNFNTAIGESSGYRLSNSSNFNTFLGARTDVSSNLLTYNYSTALGYNAIIDASNQIVLGGYQGVSYPSVKIPGSYVGINGAYNPGNGYSLDVIGKTNITLSDASSNNPNLTLRGGVSGGGGAYLQFIGGGSANENVGINFDTFGRPTPATTIRSVDNGYYSGNLQFLTAPLSTIDANNPQSVSMVINPQATGNAFVGIGKTNPAYTLDVSGILQVQDGTFDPMFITTLHGLNVSASNFYYNPKTPTNINSFKIELDGANCLIYKGTPNPFSYQDASATVIQNDGGNGGIALVSTSTYIYVNKNGSTPGVGIMTSNPQYTLDVSGNINFTGSLLEDGAPFSGTTQWTTSGLNIYYNTGTVGIGTASPNTTYKLDVNGKVNATLYNSTSDYRIKENVTQLDSTFVVDNLNPVTYLNNKLGKQDIGLIAHELQEIYPELVNGEKDGEQFQSVNYLGLIPILIKEIKELKKEIKSVKTELNELKNK